MTTSTPTPRRRRRFFRSGELHLVLLALLAERPRHGYDLMAELNDRFGPDYTASPGSIYPALSSLEDEGLVAGVDDGDRKVLGLTDTGREAIDQRAAALASIEARTGARLRAPGLEPALSRLVARVRAVAHRVDPTRVEALLDDAGAAVERLADQHDHRDGDQADKEMHR